MEAEEPASADPVPVEQDLRPTRVLAEHDVRLREDTQNPERDVLEVPDRGRADGERHRNVLALAVERLEADETGTDETGVVPELGGNDPYERVCR